MCQYRKKHILDIMFVSDRDFLINEEVIDNIVISDHAFNILPTYYIIIISNFLLLYRCLWFVSWLLVKFSIIISDKYITLPILLLKSSCSLYNCATSYSIGNYLIFNIEKLRNKWLISYLLIEFRFMDELMDF